MGFVCFQEHQESSKLPSYSPMGFSAGSVIRPWEREEQKEEASEPGLGSALTTT